MAESVLIYKPYKYTLNVNKTFSGISYSDNYHLNNLIELKKLIKQVNSFSYNTGCSLSIREVVYDSTSGTLTSRNTNVNELLADIYVEHFELTVRTTDSNNADYYDFDTLEEVKLFLRHYRSSLGSRPTYKIKKTKRYFDKNDNYKIKQSYEYIYVL